MWPELPTDVIAELESPFHVDLVSEAVCGASRLREAVCDSSDVEDAPAVGYQHVVLGSDLGSCVVDDHVGGQLFRQGDDHAFGQVVPVPVAGRCQHDGGSAFCRPRRLDLVEAAGD